MILTCQGFLAVKMILWNKRRALYICQTNYLLFISLIDVSGMKRTGVKVHHACSLRFQPDSASCLVSHLALRSLVNSFELWYHTGMKLIRFFFFSADFRHFQSPVCIAFSFKADAYFFLSKLFFDLITRQNKFQ